MRWRRGHLIAGLALLVVAAGAATVWYAFGGADVFNGRSRPGLATGTTGAETAQRQSARISSAPKAGGGRPVVPELEAGHISDLGVKSSLNHAESTASSTFGMEPFERTEPSSFEAAPDDGNLVRPQPAFSGGSFRGYRVYPGRNRARFNSVGLRPGDLVLELNGAKLSVVASDVAALRGVGSGTVATLTIERAGQVEYIFID